MNRVWLAALIGLMSCKQGEAAKPEPSSGEEVWLKPQQVKEAKLVIAPVQDQNVGGAVVTSGKIGFDDLAVSHVFSPVTGRVTKITAQPGQRVKKGDLLAVIDSPDVGTAFSDLAKSHADMDAAEKDARRQKELFEAHAGSQKDYEAAQSALAQKKAEYERARKKAQLLRSGSGGVNQEYTLRAPIDGEVVARNVNPGAEVQGQYSGGQAVELFTIGELDHVWVLADVFEIDLARIKQGAHVTVKVVSYPDRHFEGKVDWVSSSLDANTRTAKVRCAVANPDRALKPEMYATVSISVDERKALAIPRSAMLRIGDQTMVFVQTSQNQNGDVKFERRPVHVDEDQGADYLPVTHGLERGEKVVTSGAILLSGML